MVIHPSGMRDKLKTNRKYSINYCFLIVFVGTDPSEELAKGVYLGFEGCLYYGRNCVIGGKISSAPKSCKFC